MMARVLLLPEVEEELVRRPGPEEVAIRTVMLKLEALGSRLPYPHQSAVRRAEDLHELRSRSGRSPWRAFYRRIGTEDFLIESVGPEALVNLQGFRRSVRIAEERITAFREYGE